MIEETGVVKKIDGITATVSVQKRGACEGCAATGVCETAADGMEIKALNAARAKVGQTVRVTIKPHTYVKGTMMIYGLPMATLIAGAIIGKNLGDAYLPDYDSDIVAALLGFASLIVSFLFVKNWSRKVETKADYQPVIEEILETVKL